MNSRWLTLTGMLGVLVLGFGILWSRNPVTEAISEMPAQPSYYLKDAIVTTTEENGMPNVRLIAGSIEQRPGDESIVLHSVRVDYLKVPDKKWFLSAQQGFVPPDSHKIQFSGDVELRPVDGPSSAVLRSDELTIDSDRNLAYTTTSPVAMRFGSYSMNVKHFEADLKTEKVRMESVNGRSDAG
jgi:LPS export ABC transporter protein LptC